VDLSHKGEEAMGLRATMRRHLYSQGRFCIAYTQGNAVLAHSAVRTQEEGHYDETDLALGA
jgi:hypothetical protein